MCFFKSKGRLLFCFLCMWAGALPVYAKVIPEGLIRVAEEDFPKGIYRCMLQDEESPKILFDEEERSFQVNEPLQLRITRKQEFLLRFYSPREIRNVTVWARYKNSGNKFKLAEFAVIPAFAEFRIPLPFLRTDCLFRTAEGKEIVVPSRQRGEELKTEIECSDSYYRKLLFTKCHWEISFGAYSGKNWTPLLPAHAREAVAVALNMAYLFSTDEFRTELMSYKEKLYKDNQRNKVDVERLYENIFKLPALVYGHVTGVNGLGGGSVFGLAEWCYLEHYPDDNCITHTLFHEFAHCLGYTHEGNMTYENGLGKGWVALCGELYRKMGMEERLPVYSRSFLKTRQNPRLYSYVNKD